MKNLTLFFLLIFGGVSCSNAPEEFSEDKEQVKSDSQGKDSASENDDSLTDEQDTEENNTDSIDPEGCVEIDTEETDTGADTGIDTDTGTDTDTGADTDTGTEEIDTAPDTVSDTADYECPPDMVAQSPGFCIDKYEASRPDASAVNPGTDESMAVSQKGVIPWYVNPMTFAALETFQAACEAAGKRLCSAQEWLNACQGPDETTYFFGKKWDPKVCNSVDTYCQECCDILGLDSCPLSENCGYDQRLSSVYEPETCFITEDYGIDTCHVCFHVMPTGSFDGCSSEAGLFDVNGNVWEVVPVSTDIDPRGYQIKGGAFNCGSPSSRFQCTYNATWQQLYAGFRCCQDRSTL